MSFAGLLDLSNSHSVNSNDKQGVMVPFSDYFVI